jgi:hypothetical protein
MEVLIGVVVVASLALVAWWKHEESLAQQAQLDVLSKSLSEVTEKLNKPWGESPEPSDEADVIAQLDEEWLKAADSLVEFDDDLVALGGTEEE